MVRASGIKKHFLEAMESLLTLPHIIHNVIGFPRFVGALARVEREVLHDDLDLGTTRRRFALLALLALCRWVCRE